MERKPVTFAKRSLGQNFLTDLNFIQKIVDAVDPTDSDTVVEIGAGRGALTRKILEKAGRVIAIELDRDLVPLLEEDFGSRDNFKLLSVNALDVDFSSLRHGAPKMKLVANLPYYISTAILQRLIDFRYNFSQMVLMFQREVVERITAEPGSTDRGYFTVLVEAYLSVETLFDVPPNAFHPRPKVWSAVVRFVPKEDDPVFAGHQTAFRQLVSAGFRQKRKTILNNLKAAKSPLSLQNDVENSLAKCDIDPARRAETLTIDEWKRLVTVLT